MLSWRSARRRRPRLSSSLIRECPTVRWSPSRATGDPESTRAVKPRVRSSAERRASCPCRAGSSSALSRTPRCTRSGPTDHQRSKSAVRAVDRLELVEQLAIFTDCRARVGCEVAPTRRTCPPCHRPMTARCPRRRGSVLVGARTRNAPWDKSDRLFSASGPLNGAVTPAASRPTPNVHSPYGCDPRVPEPSRQSLGR